MMQAHTFHRILVPVDFNEMSAHALRTAALLAKQCGDVRITALHANWFEVPPYFTSGRLAELEGEFREARALAEQSVGTFVETALGGSNGVEIRVTDSLPADAIRGYASVEKPDLVVMGTHGRSGLNRWMLGSVAERVLRESPVPVLTVRSVLHDPVRRVLCPVHDTHLSRQALTLAAGISACFGASLTVLHVHEAPGSNPIAGLCDWIPKEERVLCQIRELVRQGDAAEEIIRLSAEEAFDLMVLGAPRRRFFDGMVLGTTTLRTVRHSVCPVLTVGADETR